MPSRGERRQLRSIHIDAELADWLDRESATHIQGREIIVERALRDYRRVVERDQLNPRPGGAS